MLRLRRWTAPDPLRAGVVAPLISGRRPMINFLAFWLGGIAVAIGFGRMTLNLLRSSLPALAHDMSSLLSGITGGHLKIVIGGLALLVTAVTAVRLAPQRWQAPLGRGGLPTLIRRPATSTAISLLMARANRWARFMAGRKRTTPWVEYVMALSVIVASAAALSVQFHASAAFIVAILTFTELPVVCYIVNPKQTHAIVVPVHNWVRAHRRGILAAGAGVLGVIVVTSGIAGI